MVSKGVAIVTGGAKGIGRQIALRLASDGFDVAICDLKSNQGLLDAVVAEIQAQGRQSFGQIADVSNEVDVQQLVARAVSDLGGVDVMVANAGICPQQLLVETDTEVFDRVMAINVRGVMLCYKYAAIQMVAQGRGGRIIGACSIGGKKGLPYSSAYCASKFAVRGLTQTAAMELGQHGITVNAYAAGVIQTDLFTAVEEFATKAHGLEEGQVLQAFTAKIAVGHIGTPAEVASLVSYLVSKEAHFITGQSINVDGGYEFD